MIDFGVPVSEYLESRRLIEIFEDNREEWIERASSIITLQEATGRESRYGINVRGNVRAFWRGLITYGQFIDSMLSTIRRGLTIAWYEGMKICGLKPEDMTSAENSHLENIIFVEFSKLHGLADWLVENTRQLGGKFKDLLYRLTLWIGRYSDVVNQAKLLACKDKLLIWDVTAGKKHCPSCASLEGIVKRASEWLKAGIFPKRPENHNLDCGGWKCGCGLNPTSNPRTTEPFPALP